MDNQKCSKDCFNDVDSVSVLDVTTVYTFVYNFVRTDPSDKSFQNENKSVVISMNFAVLSSINTYGFFVS